jgi:hypothetical protein
MLLVEGGRIHTPLAKMQAGDDIGLLWVDLLYPNMLEIGLQIGGTQPHHLQPHGCQLGIPKV